MLSPPLPFFAGATGMDPESERAVLSLSDRASQSFLDFMTTVAKFDELTDVGSRYLRGFQHELDIFRKPPLDKNSKLVEGLIKANITERMVAYVEAGFRHAHDDIQNTSKLCSCQEGLQDHIKKVKLLINELEGLMENAICMAEAAMESTSCFFDKYTYEGIKALQSFQKDDLEDAEISEELRSMDLICERILNYAIIMRIIYNMVNMDYTMQEKIVLSLDLTSSSDELESYCLMWELRPYIDDKVMRQCWRFVQ